MSKLIDEDSSTNEYLVTAIEIFDYCGADSSGTLRVDTLMDKLAPFVKTNDISAEDSYFRSLLDPDQTKPEITVAKLAMTLKNYSECQKQQKIKIDLEESFNLKGEQAPHDSDSGISTDGFQLLEELQCELREKCHLAHQLRGQLDFTDRQHEEALAALSAERDSLRAHLNMLREENMTLTHVRRDYEDVCERLCGSERALEDARRELDAARRRGKVLVEQVAMLETEKLTLQEQLTKSKEECHRINEMYASRQTTLREENETLRTDHADLTARLQDQEEFMQQLIKEKVLLEMELKDLLNKSNQNHLRMDRSIDVSYTEDQMLTELDSLNADSRFAQDLSSVSTQAELPCTSCVKRRNGHNRTLKKYFWEPLKWVFQVFAVLCFLCALCTLYGVARRPRACSERAPAVPWRWLHAQDLLDLLLSVEYVAEVPM